MSEKILTKEEVEALISAMNRGEIDLEAEQKNGREYQVIDLSSPFGRPGGQADILTEVTVKFIKSYNRYLVTSVHGPLQVERHSMGAVGFEQLIRRFGHPAWVNILQTDSPPGSALFAMEAPLFFSLVDFILGGSGRPLEAVRDFTQIEQRLGEQFVREMLRVLEDAFQVLHPVHFTIEKTESNSHFIKTFSPSDLFHVLTLSMNGSEFSGNLFFCIPTHIVDRMRESHAAKQAGDAGPGDFTRRQLAANLKEVELSVAVELGRTHRTIREILAMEAGDVIKLDSGPSDPIKVYVEEIPKFHGFPGIVAGNRAVQVVKAL